MPTKIKVDRLLLLQTLRTEKKNIEAEHKAQVDAYQANKKAYCATLAKELEAAAAQARKGNYPVDTYRSSSELRFKFSMPPTAPPKNAPTCEIKRQIATLALSKEPVITVDENSVYVKFACEV